MNKCILALDQSSKITGYALFENNQLIGYGKFTFNDADLDVRLVKIRNQVRQLIDQYQPDEIVYEDIQQQTNIANVKTFKVLAEVFGVLSELFEELKIKHTPVLSTVWKSALNIKGRTRAEQKKNAQAYVAKTYGLNLTEDESDAICLGTYKVLQSVNDWSN